MQCLLVSATSFETDAFFNNLPSEAVQWKRLVTGVGMTATAYQLTKHLAQYQPDLVVQAGIAGTFKPSLDTDVVVAIDSDVFGDLGVDEKGRWKDVFDLGFGDKNRSPFTDGRLVNPYNELLAATGLPLENAVTVNEITSSPERTERLFKKYGATIESMEGAAFHFVCLCEKIPFIQLRSISNVVAVRDKSQWRMADALHALTTALVNLHNNLPQINFLM
jgi:futalosine hydrolase